MASEKHREHFKLAMQLVRSMSNDELLRRIRSHGKGEYGLVFGVPNEQHKFQLQINSYDNDPIAFSWNKDEFISVDLDCALDAANDYEYAQAA